MLVHELLVLDVWKEKVFPLLGELFAVQVSLLTLPAADALRRHADSGIYKGIGGMNLYMVFYHEVRVGPGGGGRESKSFV